MISEYRSLRSLYASDIFQQLDIGRIGYIRRLSLKDAREHPHPALASCAEHSRVTGNTHLYYLAGADGTVLGVTLDLEAAIGLSFEFKISYRYAI